MGPHDQAKEDRMKQAIKWIGDALSPKDIVSGQSFYKVANQEIKATDGRLVAGHPWPDDTDFVVPGVEFEAIFKRMKVDPTITARDNGIMIRSGLFHGSINTLPLDKWNYPEVDDAVWRLIPGNLLPALKALRPFISDNAMQKWATCVALENDWAYATNNVALAGTPCKGLGPVMALLPVWAVDFVLSRTEGLDLWAWTPNYVAFKWENGAWMRALLVVGQFPERAAGMIREAANEKPTQKITPEYRQAFADVAEMAEDTIIIGVDRMTSKFRQAEIVAHVKSKVPPEGQSIWGASFLLPAIMAADVWSPDVWPKPAPFKGSVVCGYVVGRRA